MALLEIRWRPSQRELRVFACLGWFVCGIAAWVIAARFSSPTTAMALLAVSAAAAMLGLAAPAAILPVYWIWMIAAFPLGWLVSHALMAAVYFLVITPVGVMLRACGRDPLERRFDRAARSYWKPRSADSDKSRYFRQY